MIISCVMKYLEKNLRGSNGLQTVGEMFQI
jgi:hypothetical protein